VILAPDGKIIRFGLGIEGKPTAPLWRMWVQGDETYLAVRTTIGVSKVSLHSTGRWALRIGAARVHINGPRRLTDDWMAGPRIVYPGVRPRLPIAGHNERTHKPVLLFHDPPEANWRDFAVLLGRSAADLSFINNQRPMGSDLIGPLVHRSDGSAWIATFITQMTQEQQEWIRTERGKFEVTVSREPESLRSVVAMLIQDTVNSDTMLVNLELGRENIVVSGS
jgi:hypothetical protein